jgi:DNA recombination protein RmuC
MYVPAEGVYGEVLRLNLGRRSVYDLAMAERVIPMSPLTMFGYLQTVLFGLRCLQIETNAQEILDFCGRLQQEMARFAEEYEILGKHLGNARARHEDGARRLNGLRYRLDRVADLPAGDLEGDGAALEVVDRI